MPPSGARDGSPIQAGYMSNPNEVVCPHCGWLTYASQERCSHCQEPVAASASVDGTVATPASRSSPVVHRYRDAYRIGAALVGLGGGIKIVGAILGGIIFLGSLFLGKLGGAGLVLIGMLNAVGVGGLLWVCGAIVAAQGQILRATLDTAVSCSHFLTDRERADAMGLARSVAERGET